MTCERCYSLDNIYFEDYGTIMDRLLEDHEEGERVEVYQADTFDVEHETFVDPEDIIDLIVSNAERNRRTPPDEDGVYLLDLMGSEQKKEELKALVANWLNKNAKPYPTKGVKNCRKIEFLVIKDY